MAQCPTNPSPQAFQQLMPVIPCMVQQQQQQQLFAQYTGGRRLPTKDWSKDKPVSSVVATVLSGSSYDNLFREQVQEPPEEGLAVSVFEFDYAVLTDIFNCLSGQNISNARVADVVHEFCEDVARVADPQSVVLNFECCSAASTAGFGNTEIARSVMRITKLFLDRQHMVMFGDFSLKALIASWDSELLGPKPFTKIDGECSGSFELQFDCEKLLQCPSSQLVTVAELCDKGVATVHALSNTIIYTVDAAAADTNCYKLEVLTVATKIDGNTPPGNHCKLTGNPSIQGAAGHVLLRYPCAGKEEGQEGLLLVSMGHWIELARLDVKFEGIIRHAEKTYGAEYARNLSDQIMSAPAPMQMAQMQAYACQAVQKSAPAKSSPMSSYTV